tara:strand:+ start:1191 stop:1910 length:720 start_codon:yes stop_codon:yes gene_type:complete
MSNRENISSFIAKSSERILSERKEYTIFNNINVYIKDAFTEDIDLTRVIQKLENSIPRSLVTDVDTIIIGQFDILIDREVTALYKDAAIYVSNEQATEDGLLEDLIHEFAHATESTHSQQIYSDKVLEQEFLGKRMHLYNLLRHHNELPKQISKRDFTNMEFSIEFDMFLYRYLGYDKLKNYISGLFMSPYGATSLREYFANSFEEYYMGDRNYLKKVSPVVYYKIDTIDTTAREEQYV